MGTAVKSDTSLPGPFLTSEFLARSLTWIVWLDYLLLWLSCVLYPIVCMVLGLHALQCCNYFH